MLETLLSMSYDIECHVNTQPHPHRHKEPAQRGLRKQTYPLVSVFLNNFLFLFVCLCFKGQSFVKRKLKIPSAHPFPSLRPNLFLLLLEKKNNPNKTPHITHNPTLQTANLDSTAEERTTGVWERRERKPKRSQGLQIQRLVVPPKPRERGSFLKWCVHWEVVNTLHRAFCCPFSARGPELKPQKDLRAHGEWAGGVVEAIPPHISALSLKAVCFFHVCIWIGRVPDTENGGGGETEQMRRENGVGASGVERGEREIK